MKNRILLLLFCVLGWESIAQQNARVAGTEAIPVIKLYLPLNRAVYQRVKNPVTLNYQATFKLAGQLGYLGTTQFVSYKVENLDKFGNITGTYTDWTDFPLSPIAQSGGLFNKDLTLPTGWYSIQVRQKTKFGNFFSLYFSDNIKVGVGEVLFFAGQSNAHGVNELKDNGGTPDLGMTYAYDCVSAVSQNCICRKVFDFPELKILTRTPGDDGMNGGMKIAPNGVFNVWCYEALAKKLVDKNGTVIPVSIFNAAFQGSAVNNWKLTAEKSDTTTTNPFGLQNCNSGWGGDGTIGQPYFGLKHSLNYYGGMWGARGVVWHQGESDALPNVNLSQSDYTNALKTVIDKTREHYNSGLGWAISRVSRIQYNGTNYTSNNVIAGQVQTKNERSNTEWGAYYSDNILDRFDQTHFNKDGLVKLADLYATGTFNGNGQGTVGGNLFNLSPVEAQIAPALNATFSNDGNTLTLTVQGNYSSYCWVKGTGKLNECQFNSSSITLPNDRSQPDTDWRCYVKNGSGNYTISQTANTPLSGIRINSKNGLTGTTGSGGTGGFILDAFKLDWTISNIPSWANLNTVTGSDGQTQVNVTFQPNGGAARSATLSVSGSDGAGQLNIDISQVGTGGGGNSSCANVGSISYERWNNVGGYSTDIQSFRNGTNNLQNAPSVTQSLSLFEAPTDIADQYGARIRGYVCPPTSGNYTFWVAGDDNVELWLSSNDQPSNIQRIAYHTNWTQPQQWNQFGTQQSGQINLQAGQRYYIEALVKEGGGGDNLAVGWQLPNGTLERPIPGNRIIPFSGGGGCNPPNPPNISANPSSINSGGSSTLTATGCGGGGTVNWSNGSSGNSISVNPSTTTNYTATCSQNNCTSGNSNTATVTVNSGGGGGGGGCVVNRVRLQFRFPSDCCFDRLVGAKIQGSNDGNSWNDLYTFSQNGTGAWQDFSFGNGTAYQQVRFQASNTGWGELAEIEYYNGNTRLNGTSFGVGNYALAYDGNTGTKWETNNSGTSNVTGLVLAGCSGGGGCTPPNPPNISANPSSINSGGSSTLTATGCGGGTVNWSNGQSGGSISVSPNATTSYTATCTISCASGNSNTATVTVNSGGGGSSACSPENIQCSGNQYETKDYVVSASNSGNYTVKVFYRSHEGPGQIRWQVNGGAVQTMNVAQTSINDYPQITLGSASLNAGNNTITLSSGALFLCFKQVCIQSGARIGLEETTQPDNNELVISPNPTDGILNLKLWLSEASAVNVEVQDLTGRGVKAQGFGQQVGQFNETLNLSDLPSGMYLLQLQTNQKRFAKKLMVVR